MNKVRIWLADLVTSGDYSFQKAGWKMCSDLLSAEEIRGIAYRAWMREDEEKLKRIAAQEKPTSNSTVRRMARIARGEE